MGGGVLKAGGPMPSLRRSRPCRRRWAARASTANAFSSPIRAKAGLTAIMGTSRLHRGTASFGKAALWEQALVLALHARRRRKCGWSQCLLGGAERERNSKSRMSHSPPGYGSPPPAASFSSSFSSGKLKDQRTRFSLHPLFSSTVDAQLSFHRRVRIQGRSCAAPMAVGKGHEGPRGRL